MGFLVTCTFDLENASQQDYQNAYADLARLGLKKVIVSDQGRDVIAPTTMTIGQLDAQNSAGLRDSVRAARFSRRSPLDASRPKSS